MSYGSRVNDLAAGFFLVVRKDMDEAVIRK
jgi:hypothetical protein